MIYIQDFGATGSTLGQALYRLRFPAIFLNNATMVITVKLYLDQGMKAYSGGGIITNLTFQCIIFESV
jgi:hypothetical protein